MANSVQAGGGNSPLANLCAICAAENAIDVALAALAGRQHGVASRSQLLALGFTDADVTRRMKAARLHAVHRGVFAVGHRVLTLEGRWMAAVLAGGDGAVLSHASAAAAWDLRPVGGGAST